MGTGVTVAAFVFFVYRTSDTVRYCISVAENTSFGKYSGYILKALGISCLTSFVAGVCRDLDSEKAAQRAELIGKAELVALSLPLTAELIALCTKLI